MLRAEDKLGSNPWVGMEMGLRQEHTSTSTCVPLTPDWRCFVSVSQKKGDMHEMYLDEPWDV